VNTEITRREALGVLGAAGLGVTLTGLPLFGAGAVNGELRKQLPKFTEASLESLSELIEDSAYSGRIEPRDLAALARNENMSVEKLMLALLPLAQSYSRAPISNFHVGVVVRGESGALYTGANIEIPNQCLGFAVHAEQSALSNAYMHGENSVMALAVGGAPCGHCRQFIDEMAPEGEIVILTPEHGARKLSEILPEAFGPAALGMKHGALPVRGNSLSLVSPKTDEMSLAALEAMRKSYAPYSKSPSGVALRTKRGRIYRGSYIESVAFNPSLSPLQVALAAMIAAREEYPAIQAATLVEVHGAKISQRAVTETVLTAVAPGMQLEIVAARL